MTNYFSAPSFLSSVFLGDIEIHVDPAVPFHPNHAAIFTRVKYSMSVLISDTCTSKQS